MYLTSQQYKDGIYAPARTIKGKVTFDISDTTISDDTITITVSSESPISNKAQLTDKVRENSYNLATWENNRFKLDGSFTFPDETLANNRNMGWCSDAICDANGVFSPYLTLSFVFGMAHNSAGITVTFEPLQNEYAVDFDVVAYDKTGSAVWTTSITENAETLLQIYGQFYNYKRIDVVIKKWSKAYRRARVAEVDFGIVKVYTDSDLVNMNLIEEVDLLSSTFPSPEFAFTVDNSERLFNILNPTGFYKYLQQRQQVVAEIGLDLGKNVEWIQLGNYLLWEWKSDEGSLTASFTARTNLDLLDGYEYENLTVKTNYSLYQLAVEVFAICGIKNYQIDDVLKNIYTSALVEKASCRDVLQMIAIAGCANIFVTRNNIIKLVCLPAVFGTENDTITLEEMYTEPQIDLLRIVKTVSVNYFTDLQTSAAASVNNPGISIGDTLTVDKNTLINTSSHATNVASWILGQSNLRSKYMLNWRGNPAHELLDVLSIENSYGSNMKAYVTKNEITYEGFLSAKTEAKGVTN